MKDLKDILEGIFDIDDNIKNLDIKTIGARYNLDINSVFVTNYEKFNKAFDWRKLSNYLKKHNLRKYFWQKQFPSYTINNKFDLLISFIFSLESVADININRKLVAELIKNELNQFAKGKIDITSHNDSKDIVFYIWSDDYRIGWFIITKK